MLNTNLWHGFKLARMVNSSSGLPYNVTTGTDASTPDELSTQVDYVDVWQQ